jgi:hypothetical protein
MAIRWISKERHEEGSFNVFKMKGFVVGLSLLMIMYFVQLFFIDAFRIVTGHGPFSTDRSLLTYVLISEPLWYLLELVFVVGTARSILRDRLL